MNNIDLSSNPFGCYLVVDKNDRNKKNYYFSKVEALLEATRLRKTGRNPKVNFLYYENVWKNFDFSICGKVDLPSLYKDRAQQLRDKYNYLILKYSGGSDSHNILMAFLKNNIKLDAIYVNWPLKAKEKNLYKPNFYDVNPKNELSEWDYSIKPDLDWIAKNYPEIKITLADWLEDITKEQRVDDIQFQNQNHFLSPVSFYRMQHFSDFEKQAFEKYKSVGIIEGIDKPRIYVDDNDNNKVVMGFIDWPLQHNLTFTGTGTEYFYWTPDLPLLPIEMAYQNFLYYKNNPQERYLLYSQNQFKGTDKETRLKLLENVPHKKDQIVKHVCYPYWNFTKFQTMKDLEITIQVKWGKPQDWVFWEHHETDNIKEKWTYYVKDYLNGIDPEYLNFDNNNNAIIFKPTFSPSYGGEWYLE